MKLLLMALVVLSFAACKKETFQQPPQMEYIDLKNVTIHFNDAVRYDLDGNGTQDIAFATYHIGDPLLNMDKKEFWAKSLVGSYFPITVDDDVTPLEAGRLIIIKNTPQHEWFEVSHITLAQKNIPVVGTVFWTGLWKEANHHFLPLQLAKNGKRYNGWVELSFNMAEEKIILHKAAISNTPNVDIVAGK